MQLPGTPSKVFVVGCGRSGTHLLGHILSEDQNCHVRFEQPPSFNWIVKMAVDARREADLFPRLIELCKVLHGEVYPKHLTEKSHPALWLTEKLAEALPDAIFIAIKRKLLPTVASMLKHRGTRKWVEEKWVELPIPNRFLGITDAKWYRKLPLESRCALRVIAHSREVDRLYAAMPDRMQVVQYEQIEHPLVRPCTLEKWRDELRPEQIDNVLKIDAQICNSGDGTPTPSYNHPRPQF
jgi:hypothetical protein